MDTSLQTKTLVKTFWVSDLYSNRDANAYITDSYYMTGTKTATGVIGCLYKYYDLKVKSYKYLLTVGVARQNKNYAKPISLKNMMEAAKYNEQVNPVVHIVYNNIDERTSSENIFYSIENAFYQMARGIIDSYPIVFVENNHIPQNVFWASETADF